MAKSETQVEVVNMDDGRQVEFPGKRKALKDSFVTEFGAVVCRMDFRNGETRSLTLPDSLVLTSACHGLEQKLGDEMAGVDDLDDAIEAIDELMARLARGEWNSKREAGSGMSGASVLAKALVEATGKTIQEIRDFLSQLTPAQKLALRGDQEVAPIVQRLEAAKSKKSSVDTGSLLAGLRG